MTRLRAIAAVLAASTAAACATMPVIEPPSAPTQTPSTAAPSAPTAPETPVENAVDETAPPPAAATVIDPEQDLSNATPVVDEPALAETPEEVTEIPAVDPVQTEVPTDIAETADIPAEAPDIDGEPVAEEPVVEVAMLDPDPAEAAGPAPQDPPPASVLDPAPQADPATSSAPPAAAPPPGATREEVMQTVADLFGVSGEEYLRGLIEVAMLADETLLGPCEERRARPVRTDALAPVDQIMQALAGSRGAVIRERIEVVGCDHPPRLHNIVPFDDEMTRIRFEAFVPGRTHASLKLQLDAVRQAVVQAAGGFAARYEGCDAMASAPWVVDTRSGDMPAPGEAWLEEWDILVCGEVHALELSFQPTERGVTFSASVPLEG